MKERPILFSPQMVKAIQSGIKSQTRRVVKWPKHVNADAVCKVQPAPYYGHGTHGEFVPIQKMGGIATAAFSPHSIPCPYGVPGDRLYVREQVWKHRETGEYRNGDYANDASWRECGWKKVPGIHMPRRMVRILLEVTSRRIERVESITEDDAIAEGFANREAFLHLFYDLNERAPRGTNPWVWVIGFKVLKGGA